MDASGRDNTELSTIGYIMRDCCSNVTTSKRLDDCPALMAECQTEREAILVTIQKRMQSIYYLE